MDVLDYIKRNLHFQEKMYYGYVRYMTNKTGLAMSELALPTFEAWREHLGLA